MLFRVAPEGNAGFSLRQPISKRAHRAGIACPCARELVLVEAVGV